MSKYKYTLRDYHAIKEAEIKLDGITVLSGINGCGKSTLSRWLYYLVNGSARFEEFLLGSYIEEINAKYDLFRRLTIDLCRTVRVRRGISELYLFTSKIRSTISTINTFEISNKENVEEKFLEFIDLYNILLDDFQSLYLLLCNKKSENDKLLNSGLMIRRIASVVLGVNDCDESIESKISTFIDDNVNYFNKQYEKFINELYICKKEKFFKIITGEFLLTSKPPLNIQLSEGDFDFISDNTISRLYSLKRAIYIDTPMSITSDDEKNIFWKDLRNIMMKDFSKEVDNRKLLIRIKKILGGEAVLNKDDLSAEKTLRYISSDNKINILLKDVATGYKSFSYIQRLLENGELTSETLLMIDEPEAHLHPQWIVEFARILVMLHKEIGVKIMIASHNPDMIFAIQAIAKALGVIENTNFYLAEPYEGNPHQYVYRCLGQDIEDIFKSFNVAFDKINTYAGRSIGL